MFFTVCVVDGMGVCTVGSRHLYFHADVFFNLFYLLRQLRSLARLACCELKTNDDPSFVIDSRVLFV